MKTLKASLIASATGIGVWLLGITHAIWPAHPQMAALLVTVVATVVLMYVLPEQQK